MSFASDSAVEPDAGGYAVHLSPQRCIGGRPNGGYLLAVLARAAACAVPQHPDPLAAGAHFLRAPQPRPAHVAVEVLRRGRTASQARARLQQDDHVCVEALITLGALGDDDPVFDGQPPVPVPAFDDCERIPPIAPDGVTELTAMATAEIRIDPSQLGFATGRPGGRNVLSGWLALPGEDLDPFSLLYAVDAFPPATFDLGSTGWVPTLDLTGYVRARPAPGPVRVEQVAGLVADGRVDETCRVWDARGRLVAQATQLAAVRMG